MLGCISKAFTMINIKHTKLVPINFHDNALKNKHTTKNDLGYKERMELLRNDISFQYDHF